MVWVVGVWWGLGLGIAGFWVLGVLVGFGVRGLMGFWVKEFGGIRESSRG
jgi:hypothetical protein